MKTEWPASREFSARTRSCLGGGQSRGSRLGDGQGQAGGDHDANLRSRVFSDLEMLDCVALTQAVEAIRTDSVANGTDVLTMAAIDADRHGQSRLARWGRTDVLTMAAIDAEVAVARKARPRPP